jgi:hypothetical protein
MLYKKSKEKCKQEAGFIKLALWSAPAAYLAMKTIERENTIKKSKNQQHVV